MRDSETTTGPNLPGFQVTKNIGIVKGISVRSRSIIVEVIASARALLGGDVGSYAELCEQAVADAKERMRAQAMEWGANAVIGVRLQVTGNRLWIHAVCYGTAVEVVAQP